MPAYMKLGDIKGESQDARYPGWLVISSWSSSQSRGQISSVPGGYADYLAVTKGTDSASPFIFMAANAGTHFKEVVLVQESATPGKSFGIRLRDGFISSYSVSSGGAQPMESLSLNFKSMEYLQEADLQKIRTAVAAKPGRKR